MQEVIAHRGKTNRNAECTPGYYNFEGEFNRRQDGNYNGGFPEYIDHIANVRVGDGAALRVHPWLSPASADHRERRRSSPAPGG